MSTIVTDLSIGVTYIDMHHHSTVSDGSKSPKEIAQHARSKGIGVCITDHNAIQGSLALCREGIFTIPSIEVTSCNQKDILAYFPSPECLIQF